MRAPFVTLEKVKEIAKEIPTPFHIYDEKGIRENARGLLKAFSWNKGFKEYFAVKATPNPAILKILKEEGCGVDCATMTELVLSDKLGFKENEIMFSSNVTPKEDMQLAYDLNSIINLDDITHIDFLNEVAGIPEKICLRFNPGGNFKIFNKIMDSPKDAKYGFTKDQLIKGYAKLKEMGVKTFGLHAFLSSNNIEDEYYPTLSKILFETAVEIKEKTGVSLSFINLSGGIGVPYKPEDREVDIMKIGNMVKDVFEEVLVPNGLGDIAIFTELGRYMLAPYGHLVSKVLHTKSTHKEYIGLDASAANLMRPAMYGSYHHITVLGKEKSPNEYTYDITGGLCENNDKFAIDRQMPQMEIGDYVVIHETGAHGFAMGYNYNGKLRSAEVLLKEDGSFKLIRRAETIEDYFSTMIFD